ncbi:glutamate receptor ionotropic, kainate 4 [Caerostris extrusa]|uniref:Glutamate receptor ionotropic, kainate 4 n=1 Tax=Caerostris extrusa TaxID=172846 RepID=A0AAV4U3W6_CAEEX|nr:glutamate receptor ionotropic, kainate 4 [Caerostris extrusa]
MVTDLLHWRRVVLIGNQEKDIDPNLVESLFRHNVSVICLTSEAKYTVHDLIRDHGNILVFLLPPHQVLINNLIDSCRIKWIILLPENHSSNVSPLQIFHSIRSLYTLFISSDNIGNFLIQVPNIKNNSLETVNKWNPSRGFKNKASFQSCTHQALKPLRVAMEKHFPFYKLSNGSTPAKGSDIRLLKDLAQVLQFSYKLVHPSDGSWGNLNGTEWTGMIKMLVKNKADIAMSGMTITYDRYTAVRFSIPYAFDRITYVTKKPSQKPKTWAIFWPYTRQVWIFIAASVLLVSILMNFLRNAMKSPKRPKSELKDTALYMFQALLSQGYYNASEVRCRVLMTFWWIFCITVVAGYNGSLMSFMAHPGFNPSLDTVSQLVNAIRTKNFAAGTIEDSADYSIFKDSNEKDLLVILKSMNSDSRNLVHHDLNGLHECLKRDYAYIGGELTVRADIWDLNSFHIFNKRIQQLLEGGLIRKWMESIIEKAQFRGKNKNDISDDGSMHVLSVEDVQGAFAMLSIGLTVATSVCIAEYQISRYIQRRRLDLKRH